MTGDFEWDAEKAQSNLLKHEVSFESATRVFTDPNRMERFDERIDGEDRWITIGMVELSLLVVVYTIRGADGEIIRLISARKASKNERAQYSEI